MANDIDDSELQRRVVHALVRPAVKVAAAFRVPLGDVTNLVQMAYFHSLRSQGLRVKAVGERLAISERTAKRLAKQLRENFLDSERRYDLPVRIEFMLWAQPMSRTKLKQVMTGVPSGDIDLAVEQLLSEGRAEERPGRTAVLVANRAVNTLVRDSWLNRIGGLNSFLTNLADAVYGRFFRDEPKTFARTMSFLVADDDVDELSKLFTDVIVPAVQAIDERAKEGDSEAYRMSICWAPFDYLEHDQGEDES